MQCFVVNVGAQTIRNREVEAGCLRRLTKVFLLVANVVFRAGNDTSILDTLNGLGHHDSREYRIRTKDA